MKHFTIFLILISSYSVFAQNSLEAHYGGSFFTRGDIRGNNFGLKYARKVHRNVDILTEFDTHRSKLRKEEWIPGFITSNSQIQYSHIGVGSSFGFLKGRISITPVLTAYSYKSFNSGGIMLISSSGNVDFIYMQESGDFTSIRNLGYKITFGAEIIRYKHLALTTNLGFVETSENFEWVAGMGIKTKF